jgi:hypothetical protein
MHDPFPQIPDDICVIFREWAEFGESLAKTMPDSTKLKIHVIQACETIRLLGDAGVERQVLLGPVIN